MATQADRDRERHAAGKKVIARVKAVAAERKKRANDGKKKRG